MRRGCASPLEHIEHMALDNRPRRGKHSRIDVALHRHSAPEPPNSFVERDPVVDTDHIRADITHRHEQFAGADPEVHDRHPEIGDMGQSESRVGRHKSRIVGE